MKKYILKRKGEASDLGKFDAKQDAVEEMNDIIDENNDCLVEEDEGWLCPFDFELEECEIEDPADLVPNYDAALKYLGLSAQTISVSDSIDLKPTAAFVKLCTIAKAWNRIDGFVPDFSNKNQYKYYPWFEYREASAGFVSAHTYCTATATYANVGSRLCFATRNRAEQFGRMFQDLYNQMFL